MQDNIPIEILPKVFIGSIHAAFNNEALHELGVTHVRYVVSSWTNLDLLNFRCVVLCCQILNASRLPPSFPKQYTYLSIDLRDKYEHFEDNDIS